MLLGESGDGDNGVIEADFRQGGQARRGFLGPAAQIQAVAVGQRLGVGAQVDRNVGGNGTKLIHKPLCQGGKMTSLKKVIIGFLWWLKLRKSYV